MRNGVKSKLNFFFEKETTLRVCVNTIYYNFMRYLERVCNLSPAVTRVGLTTVILLSSLETTGAQISQLFKKKFVCIIVIHFVDLFYCLHCNFLCR